MNRVVKQLPNVLTLMNLISGCFAILFAFQGDLFKAGCCILCGALFDFADGFVARLLKAYSPLGKELDSLADVVSFGVAPSMVLYTYLWGRLPDCSWCAYFAFLLAAFSAYRLAKFNIDTRQTESFIGLNTPSNAFFWLGLTIIPEGGVEWIPIWIHLALIPLSCYLLISEIPMLALKFKSWSWRVNQSRYMLLIVAAVALMLFEWLGLSMAIAYYVVASLLKKNE